MTEQRQREVGDQLYEAYSDNRYRLIEHMYREHSKSLDEAIRIAQKILDRIIFVAFCEDRGLLPEKCIEMAYSSLPPFSRVTNPRWRNFLDLFQAIDKGHDQHFMPESGYNGGLFRHDADVDDLQLDDTWTNFFHTVGRYDFRDEVNVEVLGHLFEKSISELERLRLGGFFGSVSPSQEANGILPAMPKSAERKRFGIYYTPADFTEFIVGHTVAVLVEKKFDQLRHKHKLTKDALDADEPSTELATYWHECLESLRHIKVCDPACGSGAFLIKAYDVLEERYQFVVDRS